mmetsp:Transcript_14536/g.45457  ORF Transcript_14536/g.45457 Transcript_14536/m.45457 type:complete len:379 (+) Transcript_14536:1082-2218(+)
MDLPRLLQAWRQSVLDARFRGHGVPTAQGLGARPARATRGARRDEQGVALAAVHARDRLHQRGVGRAAGRGAPVRVLVWADVDQWRAAPRLLGQAAGVRARQRVLWRSKDARLLQGGRDQRDRQLRGASREQGGAARDVALVGGGDEHVALHAAQGAAPVDVAPLGRGVAGRPRVRRAAGAGRVPRLDGAHALRADCARAAPRCVGRRAVRDAAAAERPVRRRAAAPEEPVPLGRLIRRRVPAARAGAGRRRDDRDGEAASVQAALVRGHQAQLDGRDGREPHAVVLARGGHAGGLAAREDVRALRAEQPARGRRARARLPLALRAVRRRRAPLPVGAPPNLQAALPAPALNDPDQLPRAPGAHLARRRLRHGLHPRR